MLAGAFATGCILILLDGSDVGWQSRAIAAGMLGGLIFLYVVSLDPAYRAQRACLSAAGITAASIAAHRILPEFNVPGLGTIRPGNALSWPEAIVLLAVLIGMVTLAVLERHDRKDP
ncbi:hypothetical protein STVA_10480 [Allostella vacuolata]|nr:hypothetical protein STVA_10480 [Stella vacuolata]